MSKRCLGCMEMYDDRLKICPYCGYIEGTKAEESIHMEPGTILQNKYIIGKVLGYGGFGVTYIAWDGTLQRKVAIKEYLPGEFSTRMPGQTQITVFNGDKSQQFYDGLRKFVDEAKRLAKFEDQQGIVKIYDSFEENETAYIVMEYLEGITLTEYLNEVGTVPEDDAVNMLMPVMESLQVVHAKGLLHRDIAPDNIFLTKDGNVKLIDFGASRYATTSFSRSLTVIIKPGYSPEEQYNSKGEQGPHTDVYALGATLYKMITGKTPPDAMERRAKFENQNKDILVEPHKIKKPVSKIREIAILNAMNVRIKDRTPDIETFIQELNAETPAKRRDGKIGVTDLGTWPLWLKILVPSILALLVAFGVLLATGVINFKSMFNSDFEGFILVPEITGDTADDVKKNKKEFDETEEEYLRLELGVKKTREDTKEGIIIEQDPQAGAYLPVGGAVLYNISAGSEKDYIVEVSDDGNTLTFPQKEFSGFAVDKPVMGSLTLEEYLRSLGLENIEQKGEYSDKFPTANTIIELRKSNGSIIKKGEKIDINEKITIVYSLGKNQIVVPNVIDIKNGKTFEEARDELIKAGFTNVVTEPVKDDSFAEGVAIEQKPAAGQKIFPNDQITITYATEEETAIIPNVRNMSIDEAKGALNKFKNIEVQKSYVYDDDMSIAEGMAVRTDPEAGQNHPKDGKVIIVVSDGLQPVKIKFNVNGVNDETKYVGKTFGELPHPTQKGSIFSGWYKSSSFTYGEINENTPVEESDDGITLYAHWTDGNCTVKYNTNGGSYVSPQGATCNREIGAEAISQRSQKTGYTLEGWFTEGETEPIKKTYIVPAEDEITLVAKWTPNTYTIQFKGGDGATGSTSSMSIKYDESKALVANGFSKTGYHFVNWKDNSGRIYSDKSSVKNLSASNGATVTLTAQWEANKYNIVFNGNGSTSGSTTSMSVNYDESRTLNSNCFKRDYYTFDGWATSSGGSVVYSDRASVKNLTTTNGATVYLYAHWIPNEQSNWVSYDSVKSRNDIRIDEYKWTENKTSSSSSISGWTCVGESYTLKAKGSPTAPSTTKRQESELLKLCNSYSEQKTTGYNMVYYTSTSGQNRYYYDYRPSNCNYDSRRTATIDMINTAPTVAPGQFCSSSYWRGTNKSSKTAYVLPRLDDGNTALFFIESPITQTVTYYQYQEYEKVYTYKFTRECTGYSKPSSSSGVAVSNIRVKYTSK